MKTLNQLSSSIVLSAALVLSPTSQKGQSLNVNRWQEAGPKPFNNVLLNTAKHLEEHLNLTKEQDNKMAVTIAQSRQLMRVLRRQRHALFRQLTALDTDDMHYEQQWHNLNRQHDIIVRQLLNERSKISQLVRKTLTLVQKRRLVAMHEHLSVLFPEVASAA